MRKTSWTSQTKFRLILPMAFYWSRLCHKTIFYHNSGRYERRLDLFEGLFNNTNIFFLVIPVLEEEEGGWRYLKINLAITFFKQLFSSSLCCTKMYTIQARLIKFFFTLFQVCLLCLLPSWKIATHGCS